MQTNLETLFDDLMNLCNNSDSFYYVDQFYAGDTYRVFSYRLASYTEFLQRNAVECRGHTFLKTEDGWQLACLPQSKFFNYGEISVWGDIDLSTIVMVQDKLDGSLISTVTPHKGCWFLKSKTSMTSQQAKDAGDWLYADESGFKAAIRKAVQDRYTVNMEWCSPSNTIVIVYDKPALTVLNARHMDTGEYMTYAEMVQRFGEEHVVKCWPSVENVDTFVSEVEEMTGIEGVIVYLKNGTVFKLKTSAYSFLHKTKDSINNPKALWEVCVSGASDDLRALFKDDPLAIERIAKMEALASKHYNHIDKRVTEFYQTNKHLDRKGYAILGQQELNKDGIFSLAMNAYIGKDVDVKGFMIKNYKSFGIVDFVTEE